MSSPESPGGPGEASTGSLHVEPAAPGGWDRRSSPRRWCPLRGRSSGVDSPAPRSRAHRGNQLPHEELVGHRAHAAGGDGLQDAVHGVDEVPASRRIAPGRPCTFADSARGTHWTCPPTYTFFRWRRPRRQRSAAPRGRARARSISTGNRALQQRQWFRALDFQVFHAVVIRAASPPGRRGLGDSIERRQRGPHGWGFDPRD